MIDDPFEAPPPEGPHLGVFTDADFHLMTPIREGAMMGIVQDAKQQHPLNKVILVKVSRQELVFRCTCSARCHAVYRYRLSREPQRHR